MNGDHHAGRLWYSGIEAAPDTGSVAGGDSRGLKPVEFAERDEPARSGRQTVGAPGGGGAAAS